MSEASESLRAAVEAAASNPKVAALVATGTASMGAAAQMDLLKSGIGTASLLVGFITGCLVMAIQFIKLVRIYRSWDPNKSDSKG